ncbi:hypothetical protein DL96DRAFT_118978 [Flagelloscypha sp. PMI_526]|nr:hypothetical protein DL96DRAFT_118978 [Flagelloscypha sp. PMI_526]
MDDGVQGDSGGDILVRHEDTIADHIRKTQRLQPKNLVHSLSCLSVTPSHSPQTTREDDSLNNQARMNVLSNDLLLHIFSICGASTVGKLRQCSKELYKLSMDRVVWLEILKRACDDINMPISAFPHSAFSSRDIELFATAWIRFQKVLRNVEDGKRAPEKMMVDSFLLLTVLDYRCGVYKPRPQPL